MFTYTVETITPTRTGYHFTAPTANGERLYVELTRCTDHGGPRSVPALWYKFGQTPERLADWWDVKTYATDDRGNCLGRYNPTINQRTRLLDFKWILPATYDNAAALLSEIARRAGIRN
ncbi:hypothetical protein GPK89_00215 [Gemmiger formicilis]|uniref:hypothetical protein n=1 Tax=Gemmiger formicilis TaxID=745368 RepID=UPI001C029CBF|nr:hypothetical protein [Gemmiger formicilis]MBT9673158.1 hypothetical protein [Gemmiger formicilis]